MVPLDADTDGGPSPDTTPRPVPPPVIAQDKEKAETLDAEQILTSGLPVGVRKKWMCPCHVDWELPVRRRKMLGENIVDVPEDLDFDMEEPWNDGNIQVVVESADPALGLRGEFDNAAEIGAAIEPGPGLAMFLEDGGRERDSSPDISEPEVPRPRATTSAKPGSSGLVRFELPEDEFEGLAVSDVTYRVPEKRIKLDFVRQIQALSWRRYQARQEQQGSNSGAGSGPGPGSGSNDMLLALAQAALEASVCIGLQTLCNLCELG